MAPGRHGSGDGVVEQLQVEVDLVEIRFLRRFEGRRTLDGLGLGAEPFLPTNPAGDGRPGEVHRLFSDHQSEMTGPHRDLERLGLGRSATNGTNSRAVGERVALSEEEKNRATNIGKRHRPAVDDETTREQTIVYDELVDECLECRPGPRDETLAAEEPTSSLALLERLAIVELPHEVHELTHFFVEGEQLEPVAGEKAGQAFEFVDGDFDCTLHQLEQATGDVVLKDREVAVNIDGASPGHDRGQASRLSVRCHLIGEHPPLRVPHEMHVVPGLVADEVDGIADRLDVVVESAVHPALFSLGRPEVDHPHVEAEVAKRSNPADVRRDVVDLGGHHERRNQQSRRRNTGFVVIPAIATKTRDRHFVRDLVRGMLEIGEVSKTRELEGILGGHR